MAARQNTKIVPGDVVHEAVRPGGVMEGCAVWAWGGYDLSVSIAPAGAKIQTEQTGSKGEQNHEIVDESSKHTHLRGIPKPAGCAMRSSDVGVSQQKK